MVNFVVARNEKVSNNIPDDLAFSILSKLPLKSLKRFVCIRKSWAFFSETPYFINMLGKNFLLNNHSYYDDASILAHQTITNDQDFALYYLFGERCENNAKLDWPNPFQEDDPVFDIFGYGSVNGFFCLSSDSELNVKVVLWNPATNELKVIPRSPVEFVPAHIKVEIDLVGFGYDCVRDDYKVIRRVTYFPESESKLDRTTDILESEDISYDLFWEIYSIESDSWKKMYADISNYEDPGVYVDGVCHWWGECEIEEKTYLVSFDLRKDEFITTPIPLDEQGCYDFLSVLSGHVALISNYEGETTFHISILGEIGVMESWVKLYTVGPLPCIMLPIGVWKSGIFFRKYDGGVAYLDLCTQAIEELGVIGDGSCRKMLSYKPSLLPIDV